MLFKEIISLIKIVDTENVIGDVIGIEVKKMVYADKQSIRQTEFYQSAATGLRPEIMFVVRTEDYEHEPKLEYKKKTYTIIRTYNKGEFTELVCQGLVNKDATS